MIIYATASIGVIITGIIIIGLQWLELMENANNTDEED